MQINMVGDNEELRILAERILETYTLEEVLEMNDLSQEELVYRLLLDGLIDSDLSVILD